MKRTLLIILVIVSFLSGFAFKAILISTGQSEEEPLKKVTGIGDIFLKCKDPKRIKEWYRIHLGLNTNQYGTVFEWRQGADTAKKGFTQWSPFTEKTTYFAPSKKDFM